MPAGINLLCTHPLFVDCRVFALKPEMTIIRHNVFSSPFGAKTMARHFVGDITTF